MENEIQKYASILCPECSHYKECDHDKFIINKYKNNRNVKCFDYEWKNSQK